MLRKGVADSHHVRPDSDPAFVLRYFGRSNRSKPSYGPHVPDHVQFIDRWLDIHAPSMSSIGIERDCGVRLLRRPAENELDRHDTDVKLAETASNTDQTACICEQVDRLLIAGRSCDRKCGHRERVLAQLRLKIPRNVRCGLKKSRNKAFRSHSCTP